MKTNHFIVSISLWAVFNNFNAAFSGMPDYILIAGAILVIVCVIVVCVSFLMIAKMRRMVASLIHMTDTANAIARGDMNLQMAETEPQEIAALSSAINNMTAQLHRSLEELGFQKTLLESQSEASIVGVLVVSPQGKMISYNQRFVDMWEIPQSILDTKSDQSALESVLHKLVDPQEFTQKVNDLYQHPDDKSRTEVFLKDGRVFERYTAPIQSADGTYYGRGWFFHDITESKRAEDALRTSMSQISTILNGAPIILYSLDRNGVVTFSDGKPLGNLGGKPGDVVGSSSLDRFHDRPELLDAIHRAMAGETFTIHTSLGERVFDIYHSPLLNADGENLGTTGVMVDVTSRDQVEKALGESEEKYRRLVEISPIAMWINQDGIITYMNPAALQILGATCLDQVVGREALDFIHPDYHSVVKDRIDEMVVHGHTVPLLEEKYIRLDGRIVDVEVIATLFSTEHGNAMQVLFQDITERKRAEAERVRLFTELENRNAELERFTYTVSHDLKTPLVTIRGFLGFVEKDAASGNLERLQNDMNRITEATNRMQRLLTELLELSRIGRLINPPQAVPFEKIVREAIEVSRSRLEERGVQVEIAPDLPNALGDRERLVEIVQNLMDNAVKFMGDQPSPCIEIGQNGEEDGKPIFFIKDNGIGIAPEFQENIFGLFNKLNPQSEGTGIGLSIVKRIIEVHGGRIWVESDGEKHGTTFYFTLPPG